MTFFRQADSEEKYSSLFHAFPHAVFVHDMDGQIHDVNTTATKLFGFTVDEFLGLHVQALHPASSLSVADDAFRQVQTNGHVDFQIIFRRKDGTEFPASVSAGTFTATGQRLVQTVVTDLTTQRAAEARHRQLENHLQHAQKMQAVGELAGGVAHDFNNMLTVILGNADLLSSSLPPDSRESGMVEQVVSASRRAADLTSQLLTFARRGEIRPEHVDMHRVIREVEVLLLHGIDRQIRIELHLDATDPVVTGDPASIEASLLNLGFNARDAIGGGGGCITIRTNNRSRDDDDGSLRAGKYLAVTVEDDGCGMTEEVAARAFEPFYTTKPDMQGTGLGLATVYGCVTRHGGSVTVSSRPGEGTVFEVLLPVSEDRGDSMPMSEELMPGTSGTGHVLVVDDEDLVREFASTALRSMGYTVSTAVDGADAVEVFRARHDQIDLVILDLVMPNMSGEPTFREMRMIDPDVHVLISSGYAHDATADRLQRDGVLGFLSKPFRIDELARKLASVLAHD